MFVLSQEMKNMIQNGKRIEIQILSEKLGDVLEYAVKTYPLDKFVYAFVQSPVFERYFKDGSFFSQSRAYIVEVLEEDEIFQKFAPEKKAEPENAEVAYWMGYLLGKWCQKKQFDASTLTAEQIEWLDYGYDVLHTVSVELVYDKFTERFYGKEL